MLLRVVLAALSLVAIVLWFALLRPAELGGPVQYVIIEGTSMEPTLSSGDLVLVRRQDDYAVGDVISFRTPIGPVIHRIIDGNARDGFVLMGDNNGAADSWRPTPADIVGRAWVTLPGGERLRWLAPISLSVSGALGGFKWSSQRLEVRGCDGKVTGVGGEGDRKAGDAVSRPSTGCAS